MNTLITGGAGFVGHHLAAALQARGDTVQTLVLPSENTSWLEEHNVKIFYGDVTQPKTLVEPMRGVDVVFHLAAMHGGWLSLSGYSRVNVTGTENVCRAAMAANVHRVVHISSWTYYGHSLGKPVTEKQIPAPWNDAYRMSKVQGDLLVQRLIAEEGLRASIIRPGTIFGPGDRVNFGRVASKLDVGHGLVIGSGRNALPLVYVSDLVQGLLLAADHEKALGQAFNISNDQPITQAEFQNAIADELGVARPRLHVPYAVAYSLAFSAEHTAKLMRQKIPLVTRHGVILYGADNRHSIDKARAVLGYSPQVSLREGIRKSAEWYRKGSPALTALQIQAV